MNELQSIDWNETSCDSIRERAQIDGCFLVRRLIDPDRMFTVRRDVVAVLARYGWLDPEHDPMLARPVVDACWEGDPRFWPVFDEIQRLESFHALAHEPSLLNVMQCVLGDDVFPHPRNIVRLMFPATPPTPPHQDHLYVKGSPDTWTAWIPLGDCPRELGGLAVVPRTHRLGFFETVAMPGAGGRGIPHERLGADSQSTDYGAGDVVFIHSLCVHHSTASQLPDRMRLSVDFRYQRCADVIDPRALQPHFGRETWEDVYRNWKSEEYQYYWNRLPITLPQAVATA